MNPLLKVKEAFQNGILPEKEYSLIVKRFPIVVSGISRIEKASGVNFPIAYVEPSVTMSSSNVNSFEYGILFARTIPVVANDNLHVVIQISAPLVAYGLKGTIHAILAHEFLHYLELMRKISDMELISDELSANLFENVYADNQRLFEPRAVFSDKTLLSHITKKFPSGFRDYKLEDKVIKYWIDHYLSFPFSAGASAFSAGASASVGFVSASSFFSSPAFLALSKRSKITGLTCSLASFSSS